MSASDGLVTARNAFRERLKCEYVLRNGWKSVGAKFGISGGMAYRIANENYWPKDKAICERLATHMLPCWVTQAADWLTAHERK